MGTLMSKQKCKLMKHICYISLWILSQFVGFHPQEMSRKWYSYQDSCNKISIKSRLQMSGQNYIIVFGFPYFLTMQYNQVWNVRISYQALNFWKCQAVYLGKN